MQTCDLCDQPAICHDVRIVKGMHNTVHLCREHAIEAGLDVEDNEISVVLNIEQVDSTRPTPKACPDCGMTIARYKEVSLIGCPACYETFKEQLLPVIARVQDNHVQHVGHSPKQIATDMQRNIQIRKLLKELEVAVNKENYEIAASLRDQIKDLHESDEENEN